MNYQTWMSSEFSLSPKNRKRWILWLVIAAIVIAAGVVAYLFLNPVPDLPPTKPDRYKIMMEDSLERQGQRLQTQYTENNENNETIDRLIEALNENQISDQAVFSSLALLDASYSDSIWTEWLLQADSLERGLSDYTTLRPILFTERQPLPVGDLDELDN